MGNKFKLWIKDAFSRKNVRELKEVSAYFGKKFFGGILVLAFRAFRFIINFLLGFLVFSKTQKPKEKSKGRDYFSGHDPFSR